VGWCTSDTFLEATAEALDAIQAMKDGLERLKQLGVDAIDD
jgi:hypothetical protein